LILSVLGFLLVAQLEGGWTVHAGSLFAIVAFAGMTLLLYSAAVWVARHERGGAPMRLAITCGMIAFPIFIGHGLVIPTKAALEGHGLASPAAHAIAVALFLSSMAWLGWRVHRFMFGATRSRS
jgi:hypothetical protein